MGKSQNPKGLLLVNLGTPDAPEEKEVRAYLGEFLMDPFVIDIPWLARWALVHGIILPRRPASSAELYRKIWTPEGSPLLVHLKDLAAKVRALVDLDEWRVEIGMRYGNPSIASGLRGLAASGVREVQVVPLYPQYSGATTESTIRECRRVVELEFGSELQLSFLPPFFRKEGFLSASEQVARDALAGPAGEADFFLFSYHGLPERQIRRADQNEARACLESAGCCESYGERNSGCYRAQCFETTRLLSERLRLPAGKFATAFQSRLGRTPWIRPYSDEFYRELPSRGVKRLAVLCPSFVADCLETLEEIAIRGREEFLQHGGQEFWLVPSLNSSDVWADGLCRLLLSPVPESVSVV